MAEENSESHKQDKITINSLAAKVADHDLRGGIEASKSFGVKALKITLVCGVFVAFFGGLLVVKRNKLEDRVDFTTGQMYSESANGTPSEGSIRDYCHAQIQRQDFRNFLGSNPFSNEHRDAASCIAATKEYYAKHSKRETESKKNTTPSPPQATEARSKSTGSKGNCIGALTSQDICILARAYSDAMAKQLPMQISQNLQIYSATSIGAKVSLNARLNYPEERLDTYAALSGLTREGMREQLSEFARNGICGNSVSRAFIAEGGVIAYRYVLARGELFHEFSVSSCKNPLVSGSSNDPWKIGNEISKREIEAGRRAGDAPI